MSDQKIENPYQTRLKNWQLEENGTCPNYLKTKEWAIKNGFSLRDDVSYNGFIYLIKTICETADPFDGHKLELQIYDGTNDRKYHDFDQYDMEAEFGGIMDKTTYRYKQAHGVGVSFATQSLDELFEFALKREKELLEAHVIYKKLQSELEALWEKNPELKEKYYSDLIKSFKNKK